MYQSLYQKFPRMLLVDFQVLLLSQSETIRLLNLHFRLLGHIKNGVGFDQWLPLMRQGQWRERVGFVPKSMVPKLG